MSDSDHRITGGQKSVSFFRRLFTLVLPIALQSLISALVNSADVVMIAGVGKTRCRRCHWPGR
jgi:Na+-driven multidrug efflux pump